MIRRTLLTGFRSSKYGNKQVTSTARLAFNFSDQNQPEKQSNSGIEKSGIFDEGHQPEPETYMEEPARIGMSYEDYAKQKRSIDEKKKAIEIETLKGQIKDDEEPYKPSSSEREFHRKMELDIAQFKLTRPEDYYSSNIGEREHGVFDFSDTALIEKPGGLIVEGILENGFKISGVEFEGPVILFPNQVFFWDVHSVEDIRAHNFELLNFIKPRPGKPHPKSPILSLTVSRLRPTRCRKNTHRCRPCLPRGNPQTGNQGRPLPNVPSHFHAQLLCRERGQQCYLPLA
jgi:hypothetical protein